MKPTTTLRCSLNFVLLLLALVPCACGGEEANVISQETAMTPSATPAPKGPSGVTNVPIDDSGTLDARVWVVATGDSTSPAASIRVDLGVALWEAASGVRVSDADVKGGPKGHMIPLAPYPPQPGATPAWPGAYSATLTGYERTWEFSIVRGSDHLTGVIVVGPSYPTVSFVATTTAATVNWSPSNEANVTTSVCATDESEPPSYVAPPSWCADALHDEGTLALLPSSHNPSTGSAPFPVLDRHYRVSMKREVNLPLGARGNQQVIVDVNQM